jgi:hypothetical protein
VTKFEIILKTIINKRQAAKSPSRQDVLALRLCVFAPLR